MMIHLSPPWRSISIHPMLSKDRFLLYLKQHFTVSEVDFSLCDDSFFDKPLKGTPKIGYVIAEDERSELLYRWFYQSHYRGHNEQLILYYADQDDFFHANDSVVEYYFAYIRGINRADYLQNNQRWRDYEARLDSLAFLFHPQFSSKRLSARTGKLQYIKKKRYYLPADPQEGQVIGF
ncbi:MAG: hypothetical protein IJM76_03575 [Lachnospiraceae bacterium]|nr:hypothetical protein [Lachnospiraceae bacterium]